MSAEPRAPTFRAIGAAAGAAASNPARTPPHGRRTKPEGWGRMAGDARIAVWPVLVATFGAVALLASIVTLTPAPPSWSALAMLAALAILVAAGRGRTSARRAGPAPRTRPRGRARGRSGQVRPPGGREPRVEDSAQRDPGHPGAPARQRARRRAAGDGAPHAGRRRGPGVDRRRLDARGEARNRGRRRSTSGRSIRAGALRSVTDLLRTGASAKGIDMRSGHRSTPPTAPMLIGDAKAFRQIVTNLVGNAIKFTDAGRVAVEHDDPSHGGGGDRAHRSHRHGPRHPRGSTRPRLRAVRPRRDRASAEAKEGSGLGLAITKGLVEAMGGTITVDSVPDRGSTFTVELHLAAERAATVARRGPATEPANMDSERSTGG